MTYKKENALFVLVAAAFFIACVALFVVFLATAGMVFLKILAWAWS